VLSFGKVYQVTVLVSGHADVHAPEGKRTALWALPRLERWIEARFLFFRRWRPLKLFLQQQERLTIFMRRIMAIKAAEAVPVSGRHIVQLAAKFIYFLIRSSRQTCKFLQQFLIFILEL
jgi:hypothetical protein